MKITLNDVIDFCLYMIDKITEIRDNTTDEIVRIKAQTKINTYTTMLQYILDDEEDEVDD
nr:MAG TPA: hypothetical protein [Caudoviricetes sp.]